MNNNEPLAEILHGNSKDKKGYGILLNIHKYAMLQ